MVVGSRCGWVIVAVSSLFIWFDTMLILVNGFWCVLLMFCFEFDFAGVLFWCFVSDALWFCGCLWRCGFVMVV